MVDSLPPLDRIDPESAWKPWRSSASDPWNRKWAAHLYRRASFGASRVDLIQAEKEGLHGTLDRLFHSSAAADELTSTLNDIGQVAASRDDTGNLLRGWWLYCILQGRQPLREKMTLFWHNHFATSIAKVQSAPLMYGQNVLLRAHALGKFEPMLQAISRDPAMLFWLDSNSNVKGRPNENYARELMELFTLGVGHYTEKDIKESARAFTGWHTDGQGFTFRADRHDYGVKKFLGQTGPWDGSDIIRIILQQPAAAQFIVGKLYRYLISESAQPPAALLEPLCTTFRKSDYDVAALLRVMLSSRHFYSGYAFRQRIKGPVEYVIGAVNIVYRRYDESDANYQPLPPEALVSWITGMSQRLFAPPNVKGWPGATAWLNTSTVLERDNFAAALASGKLWHRNGPPPKASDPARLLEEEKLHQAADIANALISLYLPGGVRSEVKEKLTSFIGGGPYVDERVREAVHALLALPEYQLA